jgi:transcriptional regulator with XRE-family HTH domain
MTITTAQIRGARGILNWSQHDLSERTGISPTSIGSIENGISSPRESTLASIEKAFEDSGIEFLPNDGLRKKSGLINFFKGKQGFLDFYDDIYRTAASLHSTDNIFLVNNVDEALFMKWGKDILEPHSKRMQELGNVRYNILVKEGDTNFVATSYAEYRWLSGDFFSSVPFYVYGEKLAIILFEDEPTVLVLEYPSVTEAYRRQFEAMWELARKPEKKNPEL